MSDFYRYIYPHNNGYQIKKNEVHYGWYDNIYDALFDRDRLEECNWDFEEFVWLPPKENYYKGVVLPPRGLRRPRQNIYPYGKRWRIAKRINGDLHEFGVYDSLEEAISIRNKLMECDWNGKLIK